MHGLKIYSVTRKLRSTIYNERHLLAEVLLKEMKLNLYVTDSYIVPF